MILTITMNPSVDHNYLIKELKLGKSNRMDENFISIGGKGINAGKVCSSLGEKVLFTGVIGGTNGNLIKQHLHEKENHLVDFLEIDGDCRNAITLIHDNNTHTEFIERGIYVSSDTEREFYNHLDQIIEKNSIDIICISGSINSDNEKYYSSMLSYLRNKLTNDFPIFFDVSGSQLLNLLNNNVFRPSFIKPNNNELEEILEVELNSTEDVVESLKLPLFKSIPIVMISMGDKGAIVKVNNEFYHARIPKIDAINPTGSGDSTVGGFIYAYKNKKSINEIIQYAMACGMSNAQFMTNGNIDLKKVNDYRGQVIVNKIN